jgi:hypothetical protein
LLLLLLLLLSLFLELDFILGPPWAILTHLAVYLAGILGRLGAIWGPS